MLDQFSPFPGLLGKVEVEQALGAFIRFCSIKNEWSEVSISEIIDNLPERYIRNPFFNPHWKPLLQLGFLQEVNSIISITEKGKKLLILWKEAEENKRNKEAGK